MTSSRPYLIRAMYQWMVDNATTPYLLVDTRSEKVQVPRQYEKDHRIVLNIAPMAVRGLILGNEDVSFNARFGGKLMSVLVPIEFVLAIYARENGQGMMFADEDEPPPPNLGGPSPSRPRLKVVK